MTHQFQILSDLRMLMCSSTTDWDSSLGSIRDYRILPHLKFKSTPCHLAKRHSTTSLCSYLTCVKLSQKVHTKPWSLLMKKNTLMMLKSMLNTRHTTLHSLTKSTMTMLTKKATMMTMLTKKATMTTMMAMKTAMKDTLTLMLKRPFPTLQDVLLTQ